MLLLPNQHPYVLAQLLNEEVYRIEDKPSITQNTVETLDETEKPVEALQENGIPDYLGGNNRFILILTHSPGRQYLPDEEKVFLLSILKAIKLDMDDVAIVNQTNYAQRSFNELKGFFACTSVLLFGVKPELLGVSCPQYTASKIADCKLIVADGLEAIINDTEKKKSLWGVLKSSFNV